MKLEKAIQLLQGYVRPTRFMGHEDIDDAIQLGIEALKFVSLNRQLWGQTEMFTLPGETKED